MPGTEKLDRARIAVVGTGWWATDTHIPALLASTDADPVALCDRLPEKVERAGQASGVRSLYIDLDEMIAAEKLDGAIIATDHASHFAAARRCLEAGLHVLIEKPMTLYASQARELVDLARRNNRKIVMGYNHNFAPYIERAAELIGSESFGPIEHINGIFNQHVLRLLQGRPDGSRDRVNSPGDVYSDPVRSGGGHGHLQITHLAGMVFFICGLRAKRVQARMARRGLAVDLIDGILVEFEGGALGVLSGTGNMEGGRRISLRIYCERGWAEIEDSENRAMLQGQESGREAFASGDTPDHQSRRYATTNNLIDVVLGRGEPQSDGELGMRVVELLDAAYRSAARKGESVEIDELYDTNEERE